MTPVRPIRQAQKWGRRMPSPFDDPSTSTDLDEEDQEPLEEAPSAVSTKLDPSITNPVSLSYSLLPCLLCGVVAMLILA